MVSPSQPSPVRSWQTKQASYGVPVDLASVSDTPVLEFLKKVWIEKICRRCSDGSHP